MVKPKKRFQYTLRTLLILTILCCLLIGRFSSRLHSLQRQSQIEKRLNEQGVLTKRTAHSSSWLDWPIDHLYGHDLEAVFFVGPNISNNSITLLGKPEYLPGLRSIYIQECSLSDSALSHLSNFRQIQTLVLTGTPITDTGLVHLKDMTNLEWLSLNRTNVSDEGFKYLKNLKNLNKLELNHTTITGEGFRYISGFQKLTNIAARGVSLTDQGIYWLSQIKSIEKLYLATSKIDESGLKYLNEFKQLRYLELADTSVSAIALAQLNHLATLNASVQLDGLNITDDDLPKLKILNSCWLSLERTAITDAGVDLLRNKPLLRVVYLSKTSVTEKAARSLSKTINIPVCINGKVFFSGKQNFGKWSRLANKEIYWDWCPKPSSLDNRREGTVNPGCPRPTTFYSRREGPIDPEE